MPITTPWDIGAALRKATGLTGWVWHDMRRSFASAVAEAGVPGPVADAVLNRRQSATRGLRWVSISVLSVGRIRNGQWRCGTRC
jgi:hypothetical protein